MTKLRVTWWMDTNILSFMTSLKINIWFEHFESSNLLGRNLPAFLIPTIVQSFKVGPLHIHSSRYYTLSYIWLRKQGLWVPCRWEKLLSDTKFRIAQDLRPISRLPSIFFMLNLCHQPDFAPPRQWQYFLCNPLEKAIIVFRRRFPDVENPKRIKHRFSTGSIAVVWYSPFLSLSLSALQIELLLWPLVPSRLSIEPREIRDPDAQGTKTGSASLFVSRLSIKRTRKRSSNLVDQLFAW